MSFQEIQVIQDLSQPNEQAVVEHEGWIDKHSRVVWYVEKEEALLIMADVKRYLGEARYEIHPYSTLIIMTLQDDAAFNSEHLEMLCTTLKEMSSLDYLQLLADRCSCTNLGLERVVY
ncbi:hypothetical protein [Shouchella shacheensis]|uniref:hypothetical protein n=1 Tax=Shouchella shacheensis TaxID=1649580 RepID=UPI00073FCDAC|nr:hypothetical protein [Shouchella shacheensis]